MPGQSKTEQQQLRPYRYVVAAILALAFFCLVGFVVNGIVKHLDRLPSVDQFTEPKSVDKRALIACATDLKKLDSRIRKEAAKLFQSELRDPHEALWQALEKSRLEIIARCKLNKPGSHAAHASLVAATEHIESQLRAFHLLYSKHLRESGDYSSQAQEEIQKALQTLKTK